ncbi:MAG: translin family protein [Candidatus Thorarchaeota archaeon]
MTESRANKMKLSDILTPIREEIDGDDSVRERTLPLGRKAVRKCSESIKMTHRKEYVAARELISEAYQIIVDASKEMSDSEFLMRSKGLDVAYQELAEAANLLSLIENGTFTSPEDYNIPARAYLTGLADTVGELRRASLDLLRNDDIEKAESLLGFMEEILEELQTFDYPNALVPDLRRKCDVGRSLVERTRGDLTRAVGQSKLMKKLNNIGEHLKD